MTTYQTQPVSQHTYYAGEGTQALLELKRRCEALLLGFLAYRAGRNYYTLHPDVTAAFEHGAHALRRWWVWLFFVKVWLFSVCFLGWMLYLRFHDVRGESFPVDHNFQVVTRNLLVFIGPALLVLLITYCRNVDYSMFKRRFAYRILLPLVKLLDKVPNWVLYLIVPCALMFPV